VEEDDGQGDEMEEGMSNSELFSSLGTDPSIRVSTGGAVLDIQFDELLSFFWDNPMDTNCHFHAQRFTPDSYLPRSSGARGEDTMSTGAR